jgi:hypothetical protein
MSGPASFDADLRSYPSRLTDKSRRKMERLIEDLNLEISSMPSALRNPFRILRDIAIEIVDE